VNGCIDGWTGERMDRWVDEWIDWWMEETKDGRTDGWRKTKKELVKIRKKCTKEY
jgi:hypothetical protein